MEIPKQSNKDPKFTNRTNPGSIESIKIPIFKQSKQSNNQNNTKLHISAKRIHNNKKEERTTTEEEKKIMNTQGERQQLTRVYQGGRWSSRSTRKYCYHQPGRPRIRPRDFWWDLIHHHQQQQHKENNKFIPSIPSKRPSSKQILQKEQKSLDTIRIDAETIRSAPFSCFARSRLAWLVAAINEATR